MNKKAKTRIFEVLNKEFNMSSKEQLYTKKAILHYSKNLKLSASTILKQLQESKRLGRNWAAMLEEEKTRKEILDAEQRGLLCGNKNEKC